MKTSSLIDDDWALVESALPVNWLALGRETKATVRLGEFDSESALLRTLLMHAGKGYSLRETALRAEQAGLVDVSDVALLGRMRSCEEWFRRLCLALVAENEIDLTMAPPGLRLRACDGTIVKEPGKTGSQWRLHFSMSLPSLTVDHFDLTSTEGKGTRESLTRLDVKPGDHILADRLFSISKDLAYVSQQGGYFLVRANPQTIRLLDAKKQPLELLSKLSSLEADGDTGEWHVLVDDGDGGFFPARVCAVKKSQASIQVAHKRLCRRQSKQGQRVKAETFEYAKYVIVITTFDAASFSADRVLSLYRLRWQIELLFKRFKSLASLGHVPKTSAKSARAWIYAKLLVALLAEKLTRMARAFSPWGYRLDDVRRPQAQQMERILLPPPRAARRHRATTRPHARLRGVGMDSVAPC